MKGFLLTILAIFVSAFLGFFSLIGYIFYEVYYGNYDHLERQKVVEILSKESLVFYADGTTQLGSLFGTEHRQYVPLRDIPKPLLNAVVAAEDDRFYEHWGIDFLGTLRAIYRNVFLGRREGASTITQQTVKNLYGRQATNLKTKFVEMINAFKMERKYNKDEILEFYLNQFHVTGNGRGIGIASKYYFDKEVQNLSLTEAAFIAGSVKAPDKYNPFTKRSLDAQQKAKDEAFRRKNYVVGRMASLKLITPSEFGVAKAEAVPFRQGKFQFNELSLTEVVQRQIGRAEILNAIGVTSVAELANLGLRITTTLDYDVQLGAQYGVRQNLSRLEMILSGFKKESADSFINIQRPALHQFYVGRITHVNREGEGSLKVSLGVPECSVEPEAITRVAKILDQPFYKGVKASRKDFLKTLQPNDNILVSVRAQTPEGGFQCDIERRPRIQGGLLVIDKGQVIAMVGGYSPYEYNRATFAKRQPGSTFKTLTYYPALQLGWTALDTLLNVRNVYHWQGQFYFPRPDHPPAHAETTLVGAGATSENLASIYLLSQLTEKLTFEQFKDLLRTLNLIEPGEDEESAVRRIQNQYNVRFLDDYFKAGAFASARSDLLQDPVVAHTLEKRVLLRSMNYGYGFSSENERTLSNKNLPQKEKQQRLNVLRNNLLRWKRVASEAQQAVAAFKKAHTQFFTSQPTPEERSLMSRLVPSADLQRVFYFSNDSFVMNQEFQGKKLYSFLQNPVASPQVSLLQLFHDKGEDVLKDQNILLDGLLPLDVFFELDKETEARFQKIQNLTSLEKLYWHDDFRYTLGLVYVQKMVKQFGIESEVQPVPSYPLGSNVVTLSELALAYQTILQGQTYRTFDTSQENQLLFIKRIEDFNGQLIWEAEPKSHQVVDPFYSSSMLNILRSTVTRGTGRLANQSVILRHNDHKIDEKLLKNPIKIPTFGKTGTTNDYTNATYVGMLPYPSEDGSMPLSPENSYVIASYVGYDTNEQMRKRAVRVTGGFGALPAWIETALTIVREHNYADKLKWNKLMENKVTEIPFAFGEDLTPISASLDSGLTNVNSSAGGAEADANLDADGYINEYAQSLIQFTPLKLPGRVADGLFSPARRFSYFKPRPSAPPARDQSLSTADPGVTEQGNNGPKVSESSGAEQQKSNGSSPALLNTQIPQNMLEGNDTDDLEIPPPPAELMQESR